MNTKKLSSKTKVVYSLRVRIALHKAGIEPLIEMDNPYKPGLRCWVYEETEKFVTTFSQILTGGK